jgi:cytochrome P450
MLLDARDEETGESMSDKQIRDETMTLFLAGHETTAIALSWALYLLSKNPAVLRKLEREVDDALGTRTPGFDDLKHLEYTRMVVEETLRLYPPAWIVGRTALEDDEIGGYFIPKGSIVAMSPYLVHRHPKFWTNPEGFDPERFSAQQSAGRHKYAYVPFGAGPRICIGNTFALMEAQLCLAMMVRRFRFELAPGARLEMNPVVTLRPRDGVPMRVRARDAVREPLGIRAVGEA